MTIDNAESEATEILSGVSQGEVLGPPLFTINMNDPYNCFVTGSITSFAYSKATIYHNVNWESLKGKLEPGLLNIFSMYREELIFINYFKLCFLLFFSYVSGSHSFNQRDIYFQNETVGISIVLNIKYLGLTVDSYLRWDHHIQPYSEKINKVYRINLHNFPKHKNTTNDNSPSRSPIVTLKL